MQSMKSSDDRTYFSDIQSSSRQSCAVLMTHGTMPIGTAGDLSSTFWSTIAVVVVVVVVVTFKPSETSRVLELEAFECVAASME